MSAAPPSNGYVKAASVGASVLMVVGAIVALYRDVTTTQAELRAFKEATAERRASQDRTLERLETMLNDRIQREVERNNRIERELGGVMKVNELYEKGMLRLGE